MINIHLKYYNMHKNEILYALICIKNHINSCINCMISLLFLNNSKYMNVIIKYPDISLLLHVIKIYDCINCMLSLLFPDNSRKYLTNRNI